MTTFVIIVVVALIVRYEYNRIKKEDADIKKNVKTSAWIFKDGAGHCWLSFEEPYYNFDSTHRQPMIEINEISWLEVNKAVPIEMTLDVKGSIRGVKHVGDEVSNGSH